jgi:hypothetical protein
LYGAALCGSFIAMYVLIGRPHAEFAARLTDTWAQTFPPLAQPLKLPLWFFAMHTGLMFAYPHGGTAPGSIVTFLCVLIGAVRLARTRPALVFLLLGPLPLAFIAAAIHAYPYGGSARTMLYMAPAFCLLAGHGLYVSCAYLIPRGVARVRRIRPPLIAQRRYARGLLVVITIALVATCAGAMVGDTLRPYQSRASLKSREAVRMIARQTAGADRWIIFNAQERVSYAPYLGDWRGVGGQFVFDVLRFAPVPVAWAPRPETVERLPGGRIWLIVYQADQRKVAFPHEQLADYVSALRARLGPLEHESFGVKNEPGKVESIEVYRFP